MEDINALKKARQNICTISSRMGTTGHITFFLKQLEKSHAEMLRVLIDIREHGDLTNFGTNFLENLDIIIEKAK